MKQTTSTEVATDEAGQTVTDDIRTWIIHRYGPCVCDIFLFSSFLFCIQLK
jgi:hypothetical protein